MTPHGLRSPFLARAAAAAAVIAAPVVAVAIGAVSWHLGASLDSATATVADLVIVATGVCGAVCAGVLTVCSVPLALAPRRSRAWAAAAAITPTGWQRVVAVAVSGTALAGLALPATAAPPDEGEPHSTSSAAGWLAPPAPAVTGAGWLVTPAEPGPLPIVDPPRAEPAPRARTGPPEPLRSATPAQAPGQATSSEAIHTVTVGESLWSITQDALGGSAAAIATAWPELYALNAETVGPDPDLLQPGAVLVLPAGWER